MNKKLYISIFAAGLLTGSQVMAADLGADFNAMDSNMDGFISQQEMLSFQQHNLAEQNRQIFEVLDSDQNGNISQQEYVDFYRQTELSDNAKQQIEQKFEQLDTDKDGVISVSEMDDFRKNTMVEDNRDLFNGMDTNKDKKVSPAEFKHFFGTMGQILGGE